MSYIDTFDHELVGFFAGLPLYHPLEVVAGSGGPDFGCTPDQLVLGGGDGEHPAIVLTQPGVAVQLFLQSALPPDGPPLSAAAERRLDDVPLLSECLQFAGWSIEEYAAFSTRCRSSAFVTPYHDQQGGTLEEWVLQNLGEFVYFALPELAADIQTELAEVCAQVRRPRLFNVQILPPGYQAPAGRERTAAGEVVWGVSAWRTERRRS